MGQVFCYTIHYRSSKFRESFSSDTETRPSYTPTSFAGKKKLLQISPGFITSVLGIVSRRLTDQDVYTGGIVLNDVILNIASRGRNADYDGVWPNVDDCSSPMNLISCYDVIVGFVSTVNVENESCVLRHGISDEVGHGLR